MAELLWKICVIAQDRFFRDCRPEDRYDLVADMFRLMWQGLPKAYMDSYDREKYKGEIKFVWFLNRARGYACGIWSRGYGTIGCPYTKGRRMVKKLHEMYAEEMRNEDRIERQDAYSCKVVNCNPLLTM